MVFIRFPFHCDLKFMDYGRNPVIVDRLKSNIESYLGCKEFSLIYNGKALHDVDVISNDSTVQVTFSLPGGKGGFGSMLRAIGAQIEKTTNREACRDLSGRRLRDINEEQRLKKWIAKEAEREAEKIKRRKARIERLKTKAPHKFFDFEYEKEISELPSRINDALSEGLQKAKQPNKRPLEKAWLPDDLPASSSDSESDEIKDAPDESPSKKLKTCPKDSSGSDFDISETEPQPSTSKDYDFTMEGSSTSSYFSEENKVDFEGKQMVGNEFEEDKHDENSNAELTSVEEIIPLEESKMERSIEIEKSAEKDCKTVSESGNDSISKEPEIKVDSPIDLLDFRSVSDLEALGLDRLKSALMARGLKCGGNLSDRAQRLWKVRGLQPNEYPSNLVAKAKK